MKTNNNINVVDWLMTDDESSVILLASNFLALRFLPAWHILEILLLAMRWLLMSDDVTHKKRHDPLSLLFRGNCRDVQIFCLVRWIFSVRGDQLYIMILLRVYDKISRHLSIVHHYFLLLWFPPRPQKRNAFRIETVFQFPHHKFQFSPILFKL
jgi:hypothetical protein